LCGPTGVPTLVSNTERSGFLLLVSDRNPYRFDRSREQAIAAIEEACSNFVSQPK